MTPDTGNHAPLGPVLEYEAYENGYILDRRYQYVREIQKGLFGRVSLAKDLETNTLVAMKAMFKQGAVDRMARHEIALLLRLGSGNEHICQLLNHFETLEFVVLVLEYCALGDLYDMIHQGSEPRAVDIWQLAKEMGDGLLYAHGLGIYHRDLKPENVLLTESGHVKICDWGLATLSRRSSDFNVGTEKYMAPECFINSPMSESDEVDSYDCRYADYWLFGITLLTAVFGTAPFKPLAGGSGDAFKRRNKSARKLLELDYNFKNFVFFSNPEVLYDIYPTMNRNCFEIFMHLLKVGGIEDDLDGYNRKIEARDLRVFLSELEDKWRYGLTVWEEEELDVDVHEDTRVFDMDGFAEALPSRCPLESSNVVPSLESYPQSLWVDLGPKLWYELDEEPAHGPKDRPIRIVEKELIGSWSDY